MYIEICGASKIDESSVITYSETEMWNSLSNKVKLADTLLGLQAA